MNVLFNSCLIIVLTLSWRRSLSCRNHSIDLLCKSIDWFLYERDLRHKMDLNGVKWTNVKKYIYIFTICPWGALSSNPSTLSLVLLSVVFLETLPRWLERSFSCKEYSTIILPIVKTTPISILKIGFSIAFFSVLF